MGWGAIPPGVHYRLSLNISLEQWGVMPRLGSFIHRFTRHIAQFRLPPGSLFSLFFYSYSAQVLALSRELYTPRIIGPATMVWGVCR